MDWRVERRRRGTDRIVETTHVKTETISPELLTLIGEVRDHLITLGDRVSALEQGHEASAGASAAMLQFSQHLAHIDTRIRTVENDWSVLISGLKTEARRRG